jgi:hypothetical protein
VLCKCKVRIGGSGTEFFKRFNMRELKKRLMKFRKVTREENQSIQYILDLLRSESTTVATYILKIKKGIRG